VKIRFPGVVLNEEQIEAPLLYGKRAFRRTRPSDGAHPKFAKTPQHRRLNSICARCPSTACPAVVHARPPVGNGYADPSENLPWRGRVDVLRAALVRPAEVCWSFVFESRHSRWAGTTKDPPDGLMANVVERFTGNRTYAGSETETVRTCAHARVRRSDEGRRDRVAAAQHDSIKGLCK